jgi:hypothetical protein
MRSTKGLLAHAVPSLVPKMAPTASSLNHEGTAPTLLRLSSTKPRGATATRSFSISLLCSETRIAAKKAPISKVPRATNSRPLSRTQDGPNEQSEASSPPTDSPSLCTALLAKPLGNPVLLSLPCLFATKRRVLREGPEMMRFQERRMRPNQEERKSRRTSSSTAQQDAAAATADQGCVLSGARSLL